MRTTNACGASLIEAWQQAWATVTTLRVHPEESIRHAHLGLFLQKMRIRLESDPESEVRSPGLALSKEKRLPVDNSSKHQEFVDTFYTKNGPCCSGCDWWAHVNNLIGECRRSAPVDAEQRFAMIEMDRLTWRFHKDEAGHIMTKRDHLCGEFKDEFDWSSLPLPYMRKIGRI